MRTTTAIASLLAAAACVSASSSTHPVLAFTSQPAASMQLELPTDSTIGSFVDSLFAAGKASPACKLDAIAVVNVDKLDRDTFASLKHSSSNSLRARSLDAPSQVTFNPEPESDILDKLSRRVLGTCGPTNLSITSTGMTAFRDKTLEDARHNEDSRFRLLDMQSHDLRADESALLEGLETLDELYPRNLVIIASNSKLHQHTKRQYVAPSSSNGNWTEPTGGVFAKYQLFSTPLILTLLLVGGVLLPIVYFAVSQLAQVQTPDQIGVRKDPITGDKKSQ